MSCNTSVSTPPAPIRTTGPKSRSWSTPMISSARPPSTISSINTSLAKRAILSAADPSAASEVIPNCTPPWSDLCTSSFEQAFTTAGKGTCAAGLTSRASQTTPLGTLIPASARTALPSASVRITGVPKLGDKYGAEEALLAACESARYASPMLCKGTTPACQASSRMVSGKFSGMELKTAAWVCAALAALK